MNRQYIGARYVPKFYNGEGGSSNWVQGIPYEALIVVSHLNHSFISKKPVPENIGAPNQNPNYWSPFGIGTQEIIHLENRIDETSTEVDDVKGGLTQLQNRFDESQDYRPFVNVLEFGVQGDGVTNDTVAFQNAINFCVDNGHALFVPNGTYIVDELEAKTGLKMVGESNKNTIIRLRTGSIHGDPNNNFLFNGYISDITIEGNAGVTNQDGFKMIMLTGVIERCTAREFTGTGFNMLPPPNSQWYQPQVNESENHGLNFCNAVSCHTGFSLGTWDSLNNNLVAGLCEQGCFVTSCKIIGIHIWGFSVIGMSVTGKSDLQNVEIEASLVQSPSAVLTIRSNDCTISDLNMWNLRVTNAYIWLDNSKKVMINNVNIGPSGTLTPAPANKIQVFGGTCETLISNGIIDNSFTEGVLTVPAFSAENAILDYYNDNLGGTVPYKGIVKTLCSYRVTKEVTTNQYGIAYLGVTNDHVLAPYCLTDGYFAVQDGNSSIRVYEHHASAPTWAANKTVTIAYIRY